MGGGKGQSESLAAANRQSAASPLIQEARQKAFKSRPHLPLEGRRHHPRDLEGAAAPAEPTRGQEAR